MGRQTSLIRGFLVLSCTVGMITITGCGREAKRSADDLSPIGACPDGSTPNFKTDPRNCGGCDIVCDGLRGEPACRAGVCVLADSGRCDPGFFDADGVGTNGCECRGSSATDCRTCLTYEVPQNGVDDDCDDATSDLGPVGARVGVPVNRVHCGARGVSCLLPVGATDVMCSLSSCSDKEAQTGACGTCGELGVDGRRWCGLCESIGQGESFEEGSECFDGLDNDHNGVRDDGPLCEVLLPNTPSPACNLANPSAECPPNVVTIPAEGSPLGELEVGLTYDLLYDRYEVSRQQFAYYLRETGQCTPDQHGRIPEGCTVAHGTGMLPAVGVTWCAAYDYCAWAGKRLPTVAEFYRAAAADAGEGYDLLDAQGPGRGDECIHEPRPTTSNCGAEGPERVDYAGGEALIGVARRNTARLRGRSILNLTGNVAEWLFDARVEWCTDEGPHAISLMRDIVCPAESGPIRQRRLLLDWAPSPVDFIDQLIEVRRGQQRMMCGGGFGSTLDAARYEVQQATYSGVRADHQGFRCARTFAPFDPVRAAEHPYDVAVGARQRAACEDLPRAAVAVQRSGDAARVSRAVDACLPALAEVEMDAPALRQRITAGLASIFVRTEGFETLKRLEVQAGLDSGAELLWLAGPPPVVADPGEPCEAGDRCSALWLEEDAPVLVIPEPQDVTPPDNGLVVLELSLEPSGACVTAGEQTLRVRLEADRVQLAGLLSSHAEDAVLDEAAFDAVAEGSMCLEADADGACAVWAVDLDLGLRATMPGDLPFPEPEEEQ